VALTIGIVGLPNVGKSTLFNALTKNDVLAANYPFATIEPNVGVVNLPDSRLSVLAEIFGSERILPAAVSFVDIAGIVRGASEGEGLGNQFLANIREADAIAQVVRGFDDDDVVHVDGAINPKGDLETINAELMLADLQTLEKAIPRFEKEVRGKKLDPSVLEAANAAKDALERGVLLSVSGIDLAPIKELGLLTSKQSSKHSLRRPRRSSSMPRSSLSSSTSTPKTRQSFSRPPVKTSPVLTNSRVSASTLWDCRPI